MIERGTASTVGGVANVPPSWIVGMATLTFGLVAGFLITALPFILSKNGVSVDRIAGISATAMSPTFWAFLLTPIVDVGVSRRFWSFAFAISSALALAAALWLFSPRHLVLFTVLLLVAEFMAVLQGNAVGGWTSEFLPDSMRGRVGGWTNAANLGGGALGAMFIMWLAGFMGFHAIGAMIGGLVIASTAMLFFFPPAVSPVLGARRILGGTIKSVVRTSMQRHVLLGFLLFLSPAGAVAAINLFGGLGPDFHASAERVIWITGAGAAITSAAGSILGGYLADRIKRVVVYLCGGMLAGICSLMLALTPHTQAVLTAGVLIYNGMAGIVYAAFTALGFQFAGLKNPTAATQLGLFAASTNGAIVYMTWLDGRGYHLSRVRGLFLVDGLAAVVSSILLLFLIRSRMRNERGPD
jgi:PAT family beta-lactamase induction signal transducer AmpG